MAAGSIFPALATAATYEPDSPTLKASTLVPKTTLTGPNHTVQEKVVNRGFMNHYRISSPFGEFSADGDTMLIVRVHEISAIAKLKEMSKTQVFAQAAGDAVGKTAGAIGRVIDDPKGTAQGISAGVGRLFKRTKRRTQDAYGTAKDAAAQKKQDQPGGQGDTASQVTEGGKRLGRQYFGVDSALRNLARDLKVDPYTDNTVLRAEMDSMAKVAAAGSFGTKLVTPSLPVGLNYLDDVSDMVWTMKPLDLELLNEKSLQKMGVDPALIKRLYANPHHTPTTQTRTVKSLERLPGVKGRPVLVRYAAAAESPEEAQFTTHLVEMLAEYHKSRESIARIVATDRIPFAVTKKGTGLAAAPLDYLFWTRSSADAAKDLFKDIKRHASKPAVWFEGRVSDRPNASGRRVLPCFLRRLFRHRVRSNKQSNDYWVERSFVARSSG